MSILLGLIVLFFTASPALAIGPHELLIIANSVYPDSVEIAESYARSRGVPERNIVQLAVPTEIVESRDGISVEDFSRLIWHRALRVAQDRKVDDHILAWAYSVGFPTVIKTEHRMSIQGMTFVANNPPSGETVRAGRYESPLFAGPDGVGMPAYSSQTFDAYKEWLGTDMPIPSMMLGYMGKNGNTKETILDCLRKGQQSDGLSPNGTVYFVISGDIRSRCREWQYAGVVQELKQAGIVVETTRRFPATVSDIIGLMVGAADVDPGEDNVYLPGAMAEHLTSLAAAFTSATQTKLTAWINAGATASAGLVVEPYSIWGKFPHARFFVHYAAGCTMIESFFQSVRCPLQILLVGDPLARPWGEIAELTVLGVPAVMEAGAEMSVDVNCAGSNLYRRFKVLCDGRMMTEGYCGTSLAVSTDAIGPGDHMLRFVAYSTGDVRNQVFKDIRTTVIERTIASEKP
ncbi:MAG: TIGR03790 family protein [Lentisphaerae bacterium]|nr:TIGR03790 family protein [Lentisphaerota bacterium]